MMYQIWMTFLFSELLYWQYITNPYPGYWFFCNLGISPVRRCINAWWIFIKTPQYVYCGCKFIIEFLFSNKRYLIRTNLNRALQSFSLTLNMWLRYDYFRKLLYFSTLTVKFQGRYFTRIISYPRKLLHCKRRDV